jgi:large subunit ribosomal protein L9
MKVFLKREVKGLGKAGEVKSVADGYAANYLLPKGLAVPATDAVIREFQQLKRIEAKKEKQDKERAGSLAERLAQTTLSFSARAGEKGKLYGSITGGDIASGLEMELGEPFDKRKVILEQPIREVGKYRVPIRLMSDVVPEITVVVKAEGE